MRNIVNFTISLSEEEYVELIGEAEKSGLSRAEFARRRIFGKRITPRIPLTDSKSITIMKQCCGLIKQLFKSEKVSQEETAKMLAEAKCILHSIQTGIAEKAKS